MKKHRFSPELAVRYITIRRNSSSRLLSPVCHSFSFCGEKHRITFDLKQETPQENDIADYNPAGYEPNVIANRLVCI